MFPAVSGNMLLDAIKKQHNDAKYLDSIDDVVEYVDKSHFKGNTLLVFMGAGNIYKVIDKLEIQKE